MVKRKEPRDVVGELQIGETEIEEHFYFFELGGVDLILGVDWLAKLGEVTINWGN